MSLTKSKSLSRIEAKLEGLDAASLRYQVLDTCRRFKTTWIELGQLLFTVHQDKGYKDWGYLTFETYCNGELGIKRPTAQKLLRSYSFLEREEPAYLKKAKINEGPGQKIADLDAIDLLRKAKESKKIDDQGYGRIRKEVLDDGKDAGDVRQSVRMLSGTINTASPQEARSERRFRFLKSLFRTLENAKMEAMASKFLPPKMIETLDELSQSVEKELER
jgi:hypothetical protein